MLGEYILHKTLIRMTICVRVLVLHMGECLYFVETSCDLYDKGTNVKICVSLILKCSLNITNVYFFIIALQANCHTND